ncbi:MAG: hypothetical protein QOI24_2276 [Acidobacteriota bacterium]|jgi:hypothetical protein|nr:hypothetical protein [Acidobacteriota bacterium]
MKGRLNVAPLLAAIVLLAAPLAASDVFLPIAGSVGNFRTDVRIFNPSASKDVAVTARFLPVGNIDNSARFETQSTAVVLTIPKRQSAVYNDAVASIFSATGLGAIYLTSPNPIIVTSRIYAQTGAGTLGQGFGGTDVHDVITRGILLQLRSDATFRTNIGAANPQKAAANVTWSLYDRNNLLVSKRTITMPAYSVIGPTSITAGFFFDSGGADLSEAWVSFSSDVPIAAYASIIDNSTTDPTYLAAQVDSSTQ